MKRYIKAGFGDVIYTRVVVIPANTPIKGYDNKYYIPEYKMYMNTHSTTINGITGLVISENKLHDILVYEIVGNNPVPTANCAQVTFKGSSMQDDAVNLDILSEEQLEYINSLF